MTHNLKRKRHLQNKMDTIKHVGTYAFVAIGMLTILSGCTLNAPLALLDKVQAGAQHVKSATYRGAAASIDGYCKRVPEAKRLLVRANINSRTTIGDITINCEADE